MKTMIGLLMTLFALNATAKILVMDVSDLRQMLSSQNAFPAASLDRNLKPRSYRAICTQRDYKVAGWVAHTGIVHVSYKDSDGNITKVAEKCINPVRIEGNRWRYKRTNLSLGECTSSDGSSVFGLIDVENMKLIEDDTKVCFMVREVEYERWGEEAF